MKRITIAIDGYSSCGKSTVAKKLAQKLGYIFIDSGAMYRAVTLVALRNGFIEDGIVQEQQIIRQLDTINLHFEHVENDDKPHLFLNNEDIEKAIREPEVSDHVSAIAAIAEVRTYLVDQQRILGKSGGVIMDGRDIGTVVFPHAELKLFMTADPDVRAERRHLELTELGYQTTLEEVKKNLIKRDLIDSTREVSPLKQAEDAIVIDNSYLNQEEQLHKILKLVEETLQEQV